MIKVLKKVLSISELLLSFRPLYMFFFANEHFIMQNFSLEYEVYFNMETEGSRLVSDILSFIS